MNSKNLLFILIALVIASFVLWGIFFYKARNTMSRFPPSPTAQDREEAKKLPKEKCSCWDWNDNYCHPIADCI